MRAHGVVEWLAERLIADLELGQPKTVTLKDVKRRTLAVPEENAELKSTT